MALAGFGGDPGVAHGGTGGARLQAALREEKLRSDILSTMSAVSGITVSASDQLAGVTPATLKNAVLPPRPGVAEHNVVVARSGCQTTLYDFTRHLDRTRPERCRSHGVTQTCCLTIGA